MSERSGVAGVREELAGAGAVPDALAVSRGVRVADGPLGLQALLALERSTRAELLGAGEVLQPLLEDPAVTDVLVNGAAGTWVDRGAGLERVDTVVGTEREVRALATRLAAACGQRLDDACPVVDGSLPDGTRLHAVLPPLSATGTLISLRTLRTRAFSLAELVASGTVAPQVAPVLRALVRCRANVLVSGATGTGKTTLLASMLSLVGPGERIVCIEEATELRPDHPHVVHLQVRRANVQDAGAVSMAELVRAAMRMRPDRLVLGECRGAEVREVLGALNTGHDGGWATVHANASADVPARLLALGALAGMSEQAVAVQAVSALDAVLHLRRRAGARRLVEVALLARRGDELTCDLALTVGADGRVQEGPAWPRLATRLDAALAEDAR
ncbi:TadA family conjugal transfer-associated ATPase [Georgenia faecalis]|uniref:TadA family conjugal transfer-associated ATPase n=1 Tax=Georgenia faecalis TaxID=2483799 RepID=A0ABV9D6T2_9MICO|nr:TadA family conjugal transfer-associated ATPase [Georgenia faecalis]